jgi:isohexenylglutaconyl-CoA hydratase
VADEERATTTAIEVRRAQSVLHVTLARPAARNALNQAMVEELDAAFAGIADGREVRAVVLRGAGGNFCAGGDLKEMGAARAVEPGAGEDPLVALNRAVGQMLEHIDAAPQVVVAVCEGAVLGGGLGLACAADVTLVRADAELGLPETSLGLPPAQIAPFLVQRLGLSQARRLALTGARLDGAQAAVVGLAHACYAGAAELDAALADLLGAIARAAPGALATTKALLRAVGTVPREDLLDRGARLFAEAVRGPEGVEGIAAFLERRRAAWNDGGAG